jgi:hypothetical protein
VLEGKGLEINLQELKKFNAKRKFKASVHAVSPRNLTLLKRFISNCVYYYSSTFLCTIILLLP